MNTNSVTKFFTLVSFFVVTGFMAATTASAAEYANKEACQRQERNACESKAGCDALDGDKYTTCTAKCARQVETKCEPYPSVSDLKENDSACEQAYKDYKDGLDETNSACESVVSPSSSSSSSRYSAPVDKRTKCSERIAECSRMAQQTSSQTEQSDGTGMASTINLFRAVISGQESLGLSSSNSCLVDVDSKEAQDAEKEFRERRKELQDEKKKIEDEAIKNKEENDKEITRITKEIQELQRKTKDDKLVIDREIREQLNASQKDAMDSAIRLRKLTEQISKKTDDAKALNFAYADRMLDTSAQKQNLRCRAALDTAKACMIKSAKGIADAACKDFPFTIKSKGPKATAELKAQLQVVNDACYEKEEREKKKLVFDKEQQLNNLYKDMSNLQSEAKEEGQRQQNQSANSQKIQQEAERKKLETEENLAQQTATLQGELAQFAQGLEAKNLRSQERLQKLAQDIQNLEIEEKTGKRSKTKYALKAVRKTQGSFTDVIEQCKCISADKLATASADKVAQAGASEKGKRTCASLRNNLPSGTDTGTGRKKSTSSTF